MALNAFHSVKRRDHRRLHRIREKRTNTRSVESEICFEGLFHLVENVWETNSQISRKCMTYDPDVVAIVTDVLTKCVWSLKDPEKREQVKNAQPLAVQRRRPHLVDRRGDTEFPIASFPNFFDRLGTRAVQQPIEQKRHSKDVIGVLSKCTNRQ